MKTTTTHSLARSAADWLEIWKKQTDGTPLAMGKRILGDLWGYRSNASEEYKGQDTESLANVVIAARAPLLAALKEVDELCQQGLNSETPKHWEAALQDIMQSVRADIAKAEGRETCKHGRPLDAHCTECAGKYS